MCVSRLLGVCVYRIKLSLCKLSRSQTLLSAVCTSAGVSLPRTAPRMELRRDTRAEKHQSHRGVAAPPGPYRCQSWNKDRTNIQLLFNYRGQQQNRKREKTHFLLHKFSSSTEQREYREQFNIRECLWSCKHWLVTHPKERTVMHF